MANVAVSTAAKVQSIGIRNTASSADNIQNMKCAVKCIMENRMTDDAAFFLPISGDMAMILYGSPPASPIGVALFIANVETVIL